MGGTVDPHPPQGKEKSMVGPVFASLRWNTVPGPTLSSLFPWVRMGTAVLSAHPHSDRKGRSIL